MASVTEPNPFCPQPNNYTSTTGVITSPSFPSSYPNNADCYYYISAPVGSAIQLNFTTFYTEACCDYLYVFDGPDFNSPLIKRFSGILSRDWQVISSSSNHLTARFVTDQFTTELGFSAIFSRKPAICANQNCNNGTCVVDELGEPVCVCNPCFAGSRCEESAPDPCASLGSVCGTHGHCEYEHATCSGAKCVCDVGYTGAFCTQRS
uniref:Uncharacterized protein n=1 Tax=Plectus sambesii TaxID=2011161 RepID=A0A914XB56_9BILA